MMLGFHKQLTSFFNEQQGGLLEARFAERLAALRLHELVQRKQNL